MSAADFDEMVETIDCARGDADYWAENGDHPDRAVVILSLADCDAIAALLTEAFGALYTAGGDCTIANNCTILAGAFQREED